MVITMNNKSNLQNEESHNPLIICLGDSFTRGLGVSRRRNWISQINADNFNISNTGINGDTTSGMLARLHADVISEHADYVLITGGINDFITGSSIDIPKNNYMAIVHQAIHNQIAPIVGIAPAFDVASVRKDWADFCDFEEVAAKQVKLNKWLHEFANVFHLPIFDFYEALEAAKSRQTLSNDEYYIDGIHLTADSHKLIATCAEDMIQNLLKLK